MTLSVRLLGPPELLLDDSPVQLDTRRAIALVALLAERPLARDTIVGLLWPEFPAQRAYANLRRTLWSLRHQWSDEAIDVSSDRIRLGDGVTVDLSRLLAAAGTESPSEEIVSLWRGEFMDGFTLPDSSEFDTWQALMRDRAREVQITLLRRLALARTDAGDSEAARRHLENALTIDPLDEPSVLMLMRILEDREPSAAIRLYRRFSEMAEEMLGVRPSAELEEIAAHIRDPGRASTGRTDWDAESGSPGTQSPGSPDRPTPVSQGATPVPNIWTIASVDGALLGRETELAAIERLLLGEHRRAVTLVGPGGVGKSRLAAEAASRLVGHFPGGAIVVPLVPVQSADLIVPAIADALGIGSSGISLPELCSYIADRRMLMVLDNLEHLDVIECISSLVAMTRGPSLLTTSREPIGIPEEWVLRVDGLPIPTSADDPDFKDYGATALFMKTEARLGGAGPGCDRADLLEILRLTDGVPLAVILAASWRTVLTCGEIARQIGSAGDLEAPSAAGLAERHRSLQQVFTSSWARLSPDLSRSLARFSVFDGPFTKEAAAAVAGAGTPVLAGLAARSLIRIRNDGRVTVHELLRQFSGSHLTSDGKEETVSAHGRYYADHAEEAAGRIQTRSQRDGLAAFADDLSNISCAWFNAVGSGDWDLLARLAHSLAIYFMVRRRTLTSLGLFRTARTAVEEALGRTPLWVSLASVEAAACRQLGEFDAAKDLYAKICEAGPAAEIQTPFLLSIGELGTWPAYVHEEAERWLEMAIERATTRNEPWCRACGLRLLGGLHHTLPDFDAAAACYAESIAISQSIGDVWGEGYTESVQSEIAFNDGDFGRALEMMTRGYDGQTEAGDITGAAWILARIAEVEYAVGRTDDAFEHCMKSYEMELSVGKRTAAIQRLWQVARMEFDLGNADRTWELNERALAEHPGEMDNDERGYYVLTQARVQFAHGDLERAAANVSDAIGFLAHPVMRWHRTEAHMLYALLGGSRDHMRHAAELAVEVKSLRLVTDTVVAIGMLLAEDVATGSALADPDTVTLACDELREIAASESSWWIVRRQAREILQRLGCGDERTEILSPDAGELFARRVAGMQRLVAAIGTA